MNGHGFQDRAGAGIEARAGWARTGMADENLVEFAIMPVAVFWGAFATALETLHLQTGGAASAFYVFHYDPFVESHDAAHNTKEKPHEQCILLVIFSYSFKGMA